MGGGPGEPGFRNADCGIHGAFRRPVVVTTSNGSGADGDSCNASPPVSKSRSDVVVGHSISIMAFACTVGTKPMVTCSRIIQSRICWGEERTSSPAIHTVAPANKCGQISQTAASNPRPARWLARSCRVTRKFSRCHSIRCRRFSCVISTPLGTPVDPEV